MIVVRHSYIGRRNSGGRKKGVEKALAHVNYIQNRPGRDREEGGREFFDDREDQIGGYEVRREIRGVGNQRVIVHKVTLAPEINPDDKIAFTREVMDKLGQAKGLDLKWYGVEHDNTDHHHVHLVVMGKDRNGVDVTLDLKDIKKLREYGDRYLEREHPRELERAREEREKKREEKRQEWERLRRERIREGLELPWMHKKIVREQLEPYEKWREKQDRKEEAKELEGSLEKIEALGKEWTKDNTLKELRGLNEKLWDSEDERIPKEDYQKLGSWIKEKERDIERRLIEKEMEAQEKKRDRKDVIEYDGREYSEKDPYKKLMKLNKELREKEEKLPYDDYQKLRGWIEEKDRGRWQGALEKGLEQAKNEMRTPERPRTTEPAGGRMVDPLQQHLMRNPVVGLFMMQAGLASDFVRAIELTDKRDHLKDSREDMDKAVKEMDEKISRAEHWELDQMIGFENEGTKAEEKMKETREKLDKGRSGAKEAESQRAEQERKSREKQEREQKDRDNFERGGWY